MADDQEGGQQDRPETTPTVELHPSPPGKGSAPPAAPSAPPPAEVVQVTLPAAPLRPAAGDQKTEAPSVSDGEAADGREQPPELTADGGEQPPEPTPAGWEQPPDATATGQSEIAGPEVEREMESLSQEPASPASSTEPQATPLPPTIETEDTSSDELEELTLPSSVQTLEPLPEGTELPEGGVTIERLCEQQGRLNRYLASWTDTSGDALPVQLWEAPVDYEGLQRQAEVLSQVRYSMLPRLYADWEQDGRRYLALDRLEGPTLRETLEAGMTPEALVSTALQLAQALRRLRAAGWAVVGLSPDVVTMEQPIRIARLTTVVRIGEKLPYAFQVPGYSAPELAQGDAVTGKEDVYTLAAILYRGFAGGALFEQALEEGVMQGRIRIPGVPQLLAPALAPADERIDLEELYTRLLSFKRHLSSAPLALQVAGGTSVGLNETRLTNEDACGYLTWCSTYEGRVAYNAVLCEVDGMGGMEAGEVASTSALRAVLQRVAAQAAGRIESAAGCDRAEMAAGSPEAQLTAAPSLDPMSLIQEAAEAVYTAGQGRSVGATITCAVIEEGKLRLGHVGDTRAYLLRDGSLTQLTRDHSLVAAMVASGMLTKEEARGHPESNKVLRSLGGHKSLPEGYIDGLEVAYGEDTLQLRQGDQLVLCSDGVWGVLDDATLKRILEEARDCESAVQTAIQAVLEGGAPDNISLIVARCHSIPAL